MPNLRTITLAALAVVAVASLLMPMVSAQTTAPASTLQFTVKPPSGAIKPETESPSMSVDVKWSPGNPLQALGGAAATNVVITFTFICPNGVQVTGPATILIAVPPTGVSAPTFSGTGTFQVTVPRTAPGLQVTTCDIKVKASALVATLVPEVQDQPGKFVVNVDYFSLNQVKVASKVKQAGPQKQIPFEMEITNFGNARTQYTFELGATPKGKWNPILPEVLLLESPNSGAGSPTNTAIFTVATPFKNGWNNEQGSYQVVIKPSAAVDATKIGNTITANMLVRVRGVYVPGLEPIVMLGAILGSALLLRLRKDEE